jgi:uncharacterized membrane protein
MAKPTKISNKTANILILSIIILAVVVGILVYPYVPDRVASHWNARGQVDGYMTKFWGIFLLPIIMTGIFFLYFLIPAIDPLKSNIESFRKYYNAFWIFLFTFFLYIFLMTVAWNLGYHFKFTFFLDPALAIFWYFIAILLAKSKRNWFVGIRTPWTLSSDEVWEKTHKLGSMLFKIAAILSLFSIFFNGSSLAVGFIIFPVIAISVITVIYSYFAFKKIKQ